MRSPGKPHNPPEKGTWKSLPILEATSQLACLTSLKHVNLEGKLAEANLKKFYFIQILRRKIYFEKIIISRKPTKF